MNRARATLRCAALLGLIAAIPAQTATSTFVVPPGYATKPANSLDQLPFGWDRVRYAQYVDKAYLTGLSTGAKISEIRYRRDEERLDKIYSSYEPMKRDSRQTPSWQISIGDFRGDFANLNPQYDHASNMVTMTIVFAASLNYTVNTPTLSPPANTSTAAPFAMKFPFNVQTFQYPGNGMVVEHFAYETSNYVSRYYVDSVYGEQVSGGSVDLITSTSVGCPTGYNRLYGSAPNPGAGSLKLHLFGAPTSQPAICYFGGSTITPVNLAFMGMSSCNLYTDLSFALATKTDAFGLSSVDIPVPANSAYVGASVYSQWGVSDQRVNPSMGFALSDAVKITMGGKLGAETVRMSVISAVNTQANARGGYLTPNRGAVFQLVY